MVELQVGTMRWCDGCPRYQWDDAMVNFHGQNGLKIRWWYGDDLNRKPSNWLDMIGVTGVFLRQLKWFWMENSYRSGREEPRKRYPLWWQPFHRCLDDGGGSLREEVATLEASVLQQKCDNQCSIHQAIVITAQCFCSFTWSQLALCLLPTGEIDAKQRSKESERTHQCVPDGV